MRSTTVRPWHRAGVLLGLAALAATTATAAVPAASAGHPGRTPAPRTAAAPAVTPAGTTRGLAQAGTVRVHRGGSDTTLVFHRTRAGEAYLDATVSARGVSWAERGNESAVVSAYVDGHYVTDIVVTSSGRVAREFALGALKAGRHTLRLHYARQRSRSDAGVAALRDLRVVTIHPTSTASAAARYAPVLYGRDVAGLGGRFQNNRTDTPLVAWHEVLPADRPGHSVIQYSVVWSNEDGGTSPPALMAQWGRTTDIEWIYRVEVNAHGRRVPGTGVFQGAGHATSPFHGRYDGTHPLLQTCTSNNNVCDEVDDPMRFALSTRRRLPSGQPREHEMDVQPWTYQVMGREMVREGKVGSSNPLDRSLGDQRNYLYVAVDHDTVPPASASGVGLVVDVTLTDDPTTTYESDIGLDLWSVNRDGPAATTVKLPAGTTAADVASIAVRRVPIGTDNGADLTVTRLVRAFFLGHGYLPGSSFATWRGSVTLTTASPTATLWPAP